MAQFGERGERDQSAFAAHGEVGFTFGVPWSPRVAVQLDYASGTDDPSDDDSHTFDPLFGARRFDLGPTGIIGAFPRSNIISPGVRLGLMPATTLRLDLKVRYWSLDEARDAFVAIGARRPDRATPAAISGPTSSCARAGTRRPGSPSTWATTTGSRAAISTTSERRRRRATWTISTPSRGFASERRVGERSMSCSIDRQAGSIGRVVAHGARSLRVARRVVRPRSSLRCSPCGEAERAETGTIRPRRSVSSRRRA